MLHKSRFWSNKSIRHPEIVLTTQNDPAEFDFDVKFELSQLEKK